VSSLRLRLMSWWPLVDDLPGFEGLVTISVYDVAERMLGQFGEKLSEYAMEKFRRRDVRVCMKRKTEGFERGVMKVIAVWCAGNKATKMVEELDVRMSDGAMRRIVTDQYRRVLEPEGNKTEREYFDNV
jgi:NADH:ubiquinone reductase (non-electrogenic)